MKEHIQNSRTINVKLSLEKKHKLTLKIGYKKMVQKTNYEK